MSHLNSFPRFPRHSVALITAVLSLAGACGSGSNTSSGNASKGEISECRKSCNQLKFFRCNDAVDHATCFQNCDEADSDQIDLFTACVDSDICDAECSTHIRPAKPPAPVQTSGCVELCAEFVGESCVQGVSVADCSGLCATEDAALATYCLERRSGCELPAECSLGPSSPIDECKQACQSQGVFGCIQPADAAMCAGLCDTKDAQTIEQFVVCTSSGICKDDSCYRILNDEGSSADVSGCRDACDDMQRFDCIDAPRHSQCHALCESASAQAVETFKSCSEGICRDDSCLTTFENNAG